MTLPIPMSPVGLQQFLTAQAGIDLYGRPLPLGPALVAVTQGRSPSITLEWSSLTVRSLVAVKSRNCSTRL